MAVSSGGAVSAHAYFQQPSSGTCVVFARAWLGPEDFAPELAEASIHRRAPLGSPVITHWGSDRPLGSADLCACSFRQSHTSSGAIGTCATAWYGRGPQDGAGAGALHYTTLYYTILYYNLIYYFAVKVTEVTRACTRGGPPCPRQSGSPRLLS